MSIVTITVLIVAFNGLMTLAKRTLDRLAPASRADSIVGVILKYTSTAVEFASANSTALPASVQAELKAAQK